MAWTTPGTAVAGEVLTASRWNTDVRDNTNQLFTDLAGKMSSTALLSAHSGMVYGNLYAGTSASFKKNIGTITHNFGTTNYIVQLTVYSTNSFADAFCANADSRGANSFAIIVSRIGASDWGDTGLYVSYHAWKY